jgi:hypothetical protein
MLTGTTVAIICARTSGVVTGRFRYFVGLTLMPIRRMGEIQASAGTWQELNACLK